MKTEHPFFSEFQKLSENIDYIKTILLNRDSFKPIYNDKEFCELMGISKATSKAWRKEGKIIYSLIGNKLYYTTDNINKLLDNHIQHKKKD